MAACRWRRAQAVRDLDLTIEAGERVLLLGPSGSGKSTLLAALAGLLDPAQAGAAEGLLTVDGLDPRSARDRSGLVLQDPETQLVMARAGDDVAFGPENRALPATEIWPTVDAALAAVGFPFGRDRRTDQLSGGEQQRLALAGVLALSPRLLLLDEPTANLDPAGGCAGPRRTWPPSNVRRRRSWSSTGSPTPSHWWTASSSSSQAVASWPTVHPASIFAEHGDRLAAAGVWVPDRPLPVRKRGRSRGGTERAPS